MLESTLKQVMVTAINDAMSGKDDFLVTLEKNIATVLSTKNDNALTEIDGRLEKLRTQLLKLANSKSDYEGVIAQFAAPNGVAHDRYRH